MKKIYLFILVSIMMIPVFGQNDLPVEMENFFTKKGEAYFKIYINSTKDVSQLSRILSIDHLEENQVIAYANKDEFRKFLELGLDYQLLTNPGDLIIPKMFDGQKEAYEWDTYPTYEAYVAMMYQFAADYPDICEVFSIGTTVEGRDLLFAKISDNISQDEAEPQFLYTGTMHGDETTGFILLLRMIDYLTSNYGTDAEVTELVDGMEIWINPAANPDGTYHGGNNTVFGSQRSNGNNIDLNRNYKDAEVGDHPDGNAWQPETILFMQLAEDNNFVLSANTHGGTEVVNYPWDVWSRLTADDDWWRLVSREYADTAHEFAPSNYMNEYDDGITNGYAWYSVNGGRQDFMNYFHNCREFTLELSDVKLLPESQLDDHWTYNKRSLINYMKQGLYGVNGIITDSLTDEPLRAKVEVLNHDEDQSYVYSREGLGNYHRLLKAGTYDLYFSAEGYIPKTYNDIVIEDYNSLELNVELVSANLIAGFTADQTIVSIGSTVQFTQTCYGDPETYSWTFEGGEPSTSSEANPAVVYNEVGEFSVSLLISGDGESQQITREKYITVNEEFFMSNQEITTCSGLFFDDGGASGNYSDGKDFTTTVFGNETADNYVLEVDFQSFDLEPHVNCDYDYLKIYNGVDANAPLVGTYCGTNGPGTVLSDNDEHALTFVFHSDGSVNEAGWVAMINCTIVESIDELADKHFHVYPNPVDAGTITIQSDYYIQELQLTNINGQLLISKIGQSNVETLEMSNLKAGIYILSIETERGVNHKKIQVQ